MNRLRTLAQEGLLAQHWPIGFGVHMVEARCEALLRDKGDASVTNQVFDQPITE